MLNSKTTVLFIIAVMASSAALAGCGSSSEALNESSSSLLLNLTIVDSVDIDEVRWRVSGGDMEDMLGAIDTSAPGSTASVELFGVPEGTGYLVELEALSTLGDFYCTGSMSFDITPGVSTPVEVTLNCRRECNALFCGDQGTDCQTIPVPDGTSCADGAGSCVSGSCEIPGF